MNTKPAIPWGSRGACLAVILVALGTPSAARRWWQFTFTRATDRLAIAWDRPVAEFVFRDEKILRPYFANVTPDGRKVTRNHPPVAGQTYGPTRCIRLWLAFGDPAARLSNKARMEHRRFTEPPGSNGQPTLPECRLLAADGTPMGSLTNRSPSLDCPRLAAGLGGGFPRDAGDLVWRPGNGLWRARRHGHH